MISDSERREVAKLLRERAGYEMGCVFKELYGDCNSAGPTCGECNERAMRYVADLIEPEPEQTCEMVDNGRELCCSVCDWRHDYDDEPVYCSGCGAKVVDNGA